MDTDSAGGRLSRRTLLRRGAVVGGTLVWTAPVVQTYGRSALAQSLGSAPPDEPGTDISFVALVVRGTDPGDGVVKNLRVKFEDDGGWEDDPKGTGTCEPQPEWNGAIPANGGALGLHVDESRGDTWIVTVPAGYQFLAGGGLLKSGQNCLQESSVRVNADGTTTVVFTTV